MKEKLMTVAALAALSPLAFAQSSVTLYGVADAGVEYLNHANANGNSLTRLTSGNMSGSRWGLRGVEDLGAGTKALYVLESGFEIDTGVASQGGRLFGRQAYVGLEHRLGRLTLGRQQNALYDLLINYDPMVLGARYSLQMVDSSFVGRYDNMAKYTGKFGPVTAIALYSFARGTSITSGGATSFAGEVPGDPKSDQALSAGFDYSSGPIGMTAIYDQQQGTLGITGQNTSQRDRRIAVAGSFKFGTTGKLFAGYRWLNGDIGVLAGQPSKRSDVYWLGYQYQILPALSLTAASYYFNDKRTGRDPWSLIGSANYVLSKRTDAFLNVGYARNKDGSNLGLNGFGTSITPGNNQTGVMLGLRHKF
ncbi:porin [Cupriavidus agavae]|uniref:Putative porin n=1 Tax=Cupriavidus agavae TaxID=1001822 RepID=A0A4Q7S7V3_9BURK|nr:porin [Cupriavidus agavae]RZT42521.1 putative porin [Cupriavidus agavae]